MTNFSVSIYKPLLRSTAATTKQWIARVHNDIVWFQVRNANRVRQSARPHEPDDLTFTLDMDHVPANFFRQDVRVGQRRHLLFASDEQLRLLSAARQWFVDGTFYVVNPPFTQLFTIHAFMKKDGEIKQVPLMYVMMSGKHRRDYKKVLPGFHVISQSFS